MPPKPTDALRNQVNSRRFIGVWHNPPPGTTSATVLQLIRAAIASTRHVIEYVAIGFEMGDHQSTPHFHFYVILTARMRTTAFRALFHGVMPGLHVETPWADDRHNREYTLKERRDTIEYGTIPQSQPESAAAAAHERSDKFADAVRLARNNKLDEIEPAMLIRHYSSLRQIANIHMPRSTEPLTHQAGLWIWGPKGTRKTSCVDAAFCGGDVRGQGDWISSYYSKDPSNKWWDGYQGQPLVLLDEMPRRIFMSRDIDMAGLLKTWAGHLPFRAEVKGGIMEIRPSVICVTANFPPEEVLANARVDLEPILKRFRIIYVEKPGDLTPDDVIAALHDLPPVVSSDRPTNALPDHILARHPSRIIADRDQPPPSPSSGCSGVHPYAVQRTSSNPEDALGGELDEEAMRQVREVQQVCELEQRMGAYKRVVLTLELRREKRVDALYERAVKKLSKLPKRRARSVVRGMRQTTLPMADPRGAIACAEGQARMLLEMEEDEDWMLLTM